MAIVRSILLFTGLLVLLLQEEGSWGYEEAEPDTDADLLELEDKVERSAALDDDESTFALGYMRDKRKPKPPDRNMYSLLRRFNHEQKKHDLIAADPNLRVDGNYTGVAKQPANFGGVSNEQTFNKNNDPIHRLFGEQKSQKDAVVEDSGWNCDFEKDCKWTWRKDIANGFFVTSPDKYEANETGPMVDANGKKYGNFLLLRLSSTREIHVQSPLFTPSSTTCKLQLSAYQEEMIGAEIRIVGDRLNDFSNNRSSINNHTQWLVRKITGDNSKTWENYTFSIGKISNNFSIILELVPSQKLNGGALFALDNIQLSHCYPKSDDTCSPLQYKCRATAICINHTSVCDIQRDCPLGDDETQNCDRMPFGSRCNFEEDWCGWSNVNEKVLEWTRHKGSTPRNDSTGPNFDHTYMNNSGNYMYVNMLKDEAKFASAATIKSVIFNPPPQLHGSDWSRYYNSCAIRFYLHKTGKHKSAIQLQVTELKPSDNHSMELLWSYDDHGSKWVRQVVVLPNITHKYFIMFIAKKGLRYLSDIAIDDISLSPECFGLNIPSEDLNGYNYYNPTDLYPPPRETHKDYVNKTYYQIRTCDLKGRFGPTQGDCSRAYNGTGVNVTVLHEIGMGGVQKWIVPEDGFYTFIVAGASGGKGSSGMGSSRGAMVRTVVELGKGQEIFLLVGQEGSNACLKTLGHQGNSTCNPEKNASSITKGVRGVLYMNINDGGGGGGGGTFVFLRNRSKEKIPLAIAAGGGGLGLGRFIDNGRQHGQAINTSRPHQTGKMYGSRSTGAGAGAGGGWTMYRHDIIDSAAHKVVMGKSLQDGGIGGKACYNSTDGRGDGGFGGGGGGCIDGGGGGGYAGGDAISNNNTTNGEGGFSFLDPLRTIPNFSEAHSGYNGGAGYVIIIPAIKQGCDCGYKCIALDARRSQVSCVCPKKWKLAEDKKTCVAILAAESYPTWFVVGLIVTVIGLTVAFGVVCFFLYNRYQQRATGILRRKILSGPDLQLDRLRIASDSMMIEYNPNYEFGGVTYTLKDLKDIPREQLRLVKALGQGAFGEVYQGFYRQRPCDTVEMPVAVKTLPEMSTSQAEMDFLMEALIMSKFSHPNIVHFIGVCFDKHPRFIVLELLSGGDLKNFLRESRPKPERTGSLTMKDMVLIAVDVAKGCKYLEENRFIHRDIAARNCLLTTKGPGRVVKIADFGMSRDVYRSDYYRKGGKAMLPIKWMPPEAFLDGIFTSKTDVWSFGVLLWEIMSMGYMPYTGCANREVMQLVTSGGRLDPPTNCPGPIYGIMTQCWHPSPEQRPSFATILERLGYCSQDPQVMTAPLPVFHRPPSTERDTTIMRPLSSDENCLQVVPTSSDYLIPNHTTSINPMEVTSSVEKLLPDNSDNWETSFILPHSRSTQPLLIDKDKDDDGAGSVDKFLAIDSPTNPKVSPMSLPSNILSNHNNNMKSEATLKSGVSLDAGALVKQSMGNGIIQNGPFSLTNQNNFVSGNNTKFLNTDSEINC